MALCTCGDPGSAASANVIVPNAMAAGMSRLGMRASLNRAVAIGTIVQATSQAETPPYVSNAVATMVENIARFGPKRVVMPLARYLASPVEVMRYPKIAPNKKSGKYWTMKFPRAGINIWV